MRKSVSRNDSGYDPGAHKWKVLLNGEELPNCFTADEERGEAFVYEKDKSGNFILDNYEEIKEKRLKGKVKLIGPNLAD